MNRKIMFTPEPEGDPRGHSHTMGEQVIDRAVHGARENRLSLGSLIRNYFSRRLDNDGKADSYPLGYESATIFLSYSEDKKLQDSDR